MTPEYSRRVKVSSLHIEAMDAAVDGCFSQFMKKRPFADIGRRLTVFREAIGISQAQVCRDIGVAPNTWNQYEKGIREIPPTTAVKLHRKYGVTTDWIYDGDRTMLPAGIERKLPSAA
jgi:DNA-binding XRE family transcriptional regulator